MSNYLLGDFVQTKRKEMGLSLRDFGKLCCISHTTIDVIERGYDPRTGKAINITDSTYEKLSIGLGVPMAHLVALSKGIDSPLSLADTRYADLTDKNKVIVDQLIASLLASQSDD